MEKEKIVVFLDKFNYDFVEKNNLISVKLGFGQIVKIDCKESNKIIIKDQLVGFNFLTGMINMSFKNALIYNFIGMIIFGFLCMYSENEENGLKALPLFLLFIAWTILFSNFYIVKLENFKNQLIAFSK